MTRGEASSEGPTPSESSEPDGLQLDVALDGFSQPEAEALLDDLRAQIHDHLSSREPGVGGAPTRGTGDRQPADAADAGDDDAASVAELAATGRDTVREAAAEATAETDDGTRSSLDQLEGVAPAVEDILRAARDAGLKILDDAEEQASSLVDRAGEQLAEISAGRRRLADQLGELQTQLQQISTLAGALEEQWRSAEREIRDRPAATAHGEGDRNGTADRDAAGPAADSSDAAAPGAEGGP